MKRILVLFLTGMLALYCISCGKSDVSETESIEEANISEIDIPEENETEDSLETLSDEEEPLGDPDVDIDLTVMSSTFIYSEVYNMMMAPAEYVGKVVKMEGNCGIYIDEETGKTYYACIVKDATQCCAQGLEFVLDETKYEATDYPNEGDEITIKGEFSTYEENGGQYLTMTNAVME